MAQQVNEFIASIFSSELKRLKVESKQFLTRAEIDQVKENPAKYALQGSEYTALYLTPKVLLFTLLGGALSV